MTSPAALVAAPSFALVRSPVAPLHAEPRVSSPQVSQTLFGHATTVSESRGDWHRVGTFDGYEGWTHAGYLAMLDARPQLPGVAVGSAEASGTTNGAGAPFDAARLTTMLGGDAIPRVSLGCTVRAGDRALRLPLGAWVHGAQTMLDGEAVPMDELGARFPADGDQLVRTASHRFAGTSYQWGGVTPWGADCSGLVQTVFALHGLSLPRDAWQQAAVGSDAGTRLDALRAGDLLFFSDRDDRRVTHVGIAVGDGRMAHSALGRGGWSVDDLLDEHDGYARALAGRFLFARRVL